MRLVCNRALCAFLAASVLLAQSGLEYQVKAAFLLNFTKFTEWPAGAFATPESPISICILGRDPFGPALDDIVQGESVDRRRVVVRRIGDLPAPEACHVLFLAGDAKEVAASIGNAAKGTLTVGEGERFLKEGGMVAFVIEDRRVRFGINRAAAEAGGLKLSSRLLSVARPMGR